MRLTKIYTRTGDKGFTKLTDGSSVRKSHARLEAYGTVDELNSMLGLLQDHVNRTDSLTSLRPAITEIQNELFDLGSELASTKEFIEKFLSESLVGSSQIQRLENQMDEFNVGLQPLKNFILPGGHPANSIAHLCRTICRRAERRAITLSEQEDIRADAIIYLNRLSDWFFVTSRFISKKVGVDEVLWNQKR